MNIPENIFNNLTEGQKEAIEAAKSPEELSALARGMRHMNSRSAGRCPEV